MLLVEIVWVVRGDDKDLEIIIVLVVAKQNDFDWIIEVFLKVIVIKQRMVENSKVIVKRSLGDERGMVRVYGMLKVEKELTIAVNLLDLVHL